MAKKITKTIVSGRVKTKQDNLLYVIANNGKYDVEYIIDCNCIVKNADKKTYVNCIGYVPVDLQECGTNVFVYQNVDAAMHGTICFDITAAQHRGNRTYYIPANSGWDKNHAFSKSSIISLSGKKAVDLIPKWYKDLQQELHVYGYYPTGPYSIATSICGLSGPALARAHRISKYMEQKNNRRIQKLLKIKQR